MSKYERAIRKYRLETRCWKFWAWMLERHPRIYRWLDRLLPFNTLPF